MSDYMEFWKWFNRMREGIPVREVERRAGAPHGRISNAYQRKEPSALVCETIAKGLELDPAEVYRRAGLLPPPEEEKGLPSSEEMIKEIWQVIKTWQAENISRQVAEQRPGHESRQGEIEDPMVERLLALWDQLSAASRVEVLHFVQYRFGQDIGSAIEKVSSIEVENMLTFLAEKDALQQLENSTREKPQIESDEEDPGANVAGGA